LAREGKPIIHMALDGTRIPFDVFDSRTIRFTLECKRAEDARAELENQIRRVQEADYRPSSPITEAIDIIGLEASHRPVEQQLARIALQIEQLSANSAEIPSMIRSEVASALNMRHITTGLDIGTPHLAVRTKTFDAVAQKSE
jgi:hypothetical protein